MTSSIRVLTTSTLDSSPAVVLTSPDGSSILVNCGEGCQRSFLETSTSSLSSLKIRNVTCICLTHFGYDSIGGLPGFILTSADVAKVASIQKTADSHGKNPNHNNSTSNSSSSSSSTSKTKKRKTLTDVTATAGLDIVGPVGTRPFIHSLRHFMKRDDFVLRIQEGPVKNNSVVTAAAAAEEETVQPNDRIRITAIPIIRLAPSTQQQQQQDEFKDTSYSILDSQTNTCSYIFQTPPISGKFILERAKKLQIPPGPLYAQLKGGQSISFFNTLTGQQEIVTPQQVLDPGQEGISIAFFHIPNRHVFSQLQDNPNIQSYYHDKITLKEDKKEFKVILHSIPKALFYSKTYREWIQGFGPHVQHITLFPMEHYSGGHESVDASPFRSAILGGMTRSFVCNEIFPNPLLSSNMVDPLIYNPTDTQSLDKDTQDLHITMAHSRMEYILIPIAKSGFVQVDDELKTPNSNPCGISPTEVETIRSMVESSGISPPFLPPSRNPSIPLEQTQVDAKIIFLGTGSALPCKHRNVSGIYVQLDQSRAMLLDVGEGSVGQLLRSWKSTTSRLDNFSDCADSLLQSIQAVWISHPHADHHLGILHLLTARNVSFSKHSHVDKQPLILMAPPCIFQFLKEYEVIDSSISGGYIPLNSTQMMHSTENPMHVELRNRLGITSCTAVPVDHCQHSFAIVIDGTPFGQVVYSGDCRPSNRLIQVAKGADLVIHEATFEDGMESEAVLKRHSTIGEAIKVAEQMDAKFLLLTHFSQRYPKIPPLPMLDMESSSLTLSRLPIAFAFDYMRVSPGNLLLASFAVDSLRKLYKDETANTMDSEEDQFLSKIEVTEEGLSANDFFDTPGAFASINCLH